jgi:DNA-binding beta-propeller fold protein YncE
MGIAHERDNAYWVFNGDVGALDRYDFHAPHVPGGEDHSDGEATRYVLGELAREPGIPSHLEYDERDGSVFVADTGNSRVVRVDSTSGMPGEPLECDDIQLGTTVEQVVDSTVEVVVPAGVLKQPSGLALSGDVLFVTDNTTSRVVTFSLDGEVLDIFDTGLPPGTLAGIAVGPDGRAYISDLLTGVVRRIEPR